MLLPSELRSTGGGLFLSLGGIRQPHSSGVKVGRVGAWRRSSAAAGRRLSQGGLLRLLWGVPRGRGGCAADPQAIQGEGRPGLNHVNPPDGNQEARRPAGLLGVQREVAQEVVGAS